MLMMEGMCWLSYCWICTGTSSHIRGDGMLAGDDDPYESADEYDADDVLRVGGDSEGVRDGAREEEFDEELYA